MDVWGGGGGLLEYRAALLASHGYAALALGNLTIGDLQTEDLDLSFFEVCVILLLVEFKYNSIVMIIPKKMQIYPSDEIS